MVLGQNRAVLVASVICFQKIYGLHGVKHQIIEYSKKEKVMTDRQTDRISSCRLDPFCRRGRVKTKKMDNLSLMISAEKNYVVSTTLQVGLHRLLPELFVHSVPLAFHWQTILTNLALIGNLL